MCKDEFFKLICIRLEKQVSEVQKIEKLTVEILILVRKWLKFLFENCVLALQVVNFFLIYFKICRNNKSLSWSKLDLKIKFLMKRETNVWNLDVDQNMPNSNKKKLLASQDVIFFSCYSQMLYKRDLFKIITVII